MKYDIRNKNGVALIGILLAVFIIAILGYGIYGWTNRTNDVQMKQAVDKQLEQIQTNVDARNSLEKQYLDDAASTTN